MDETKNFNLSTKKVKLEDGTYNFVFSKLYNEKNKLYYRCNICELVVGGSLSQHATTRKHQVAMGLSYHPVSQWAQSPEKPRMELKLAPGEPVPPGFEDEVRGITEIQASLDAFHSGPLIGLEYLVELSAYEDEREPQYICLLCDKRGDPRTVMAHLVSFNHRMTYLQTHFPTAFRAISPYNTKQYRRSVQVTVTTICEAIEKKYGRMVPQVADKSNFERSKQSYIESVSKDNHPSERLGETFEFLVDKEAILAGPKDAIAEIKKANEEVNQRTKNIRKGFDDKRDPSPPVVAKPAVKVKSSARSDRRSLSSISSISSSSLSSVKSRSRSPERARTYKIQDNDRNRNRSSYQRSFRRSRSHSRSPQRYRREPHGHYNAANRNSARLPWQKPEYNRARNTYSDRRSDKKIDVKQERFDEFKKQCKIIEVEMDHVLEQHEKNPEKHPMYPEEWKKFWNRRYKELQAENKDPTKHDFKPEWIDFWNKRMKEMHEAELKNKKDALRKRLNLPEEQPTPISFKIGNRKKRNSKNESESSKPSEDKSNDSDVIVIDDSKDDDFEIERKRSHSPWEPELPKDRNREKERDWGRDRERDREREREHERDRERIRERERFQPEYSRDFYRQKGFREVSYENDRQEREREVKKRKPMSPIPIVLDKADEINVVAILRLLTALEEKLGSLGPKIIELLAQALALEKAEANSSETLLDNEINCVLFETVKEKLKGQLLAGMVEFNAEKTFKNAIQKIASVLHFASERKKEKDKELIAKKAEPVQIPGIGTIDKSAIAKQIATALINQGKTDVTQGELEQLINAVVGMAQASQSTGKPVSTATFVQQLSNPSSVLLANVAQSSASSVTPKVETSSVVAQPAVNLTATENFPSLTTTNSSSMDGLSDSDLKTLLQNFKDLSTDEQHGLITYLKKLESREPERVERLRKFVNLGSAADEKSFPSGRISPFSNRESSVNPSVEDSNKDKSKINVPAPKPEKIKIDTDDEDYSYEDVFRAASKNVFDKKQADEANKKEDLKLLDKPKDLTINLNDAKALIANLMEKLGKKNNPGLKVPVTNTNTNVQETPSVSYEPMAVASEPLNTVNTVQTTPNLNTNVTQPYQTSSQYGFPQARSYDNNYDNSYSSQQMYRPNDPYYNPMHMAQGPSDYDMYNNQRMDYNAYNPDMNPRSMQGQFPRTGQQYQYDRQNYY